MSKALDLLKKIVEINTANPPGNETKAAEFLADYMKKFCFKVDLVGDEDRKNVIGFAGNPDSKKILAFNGHIDTVPAAAKDWETDPFTPVIDGDRCYGRGSADMKGGVVASVRAIEEAAEKGLLEDKLIIFAGTADEETGADSKRGCSAAVNYLLDNGYVPEGVIIPEPNSDMREIQINLGHRGLIWVECTALGKVGHSGLLGEEDNAIIKMNKFLVELYSVFSSKPQEIDGVPQSSAKVTYITAGNEVSYNIIPGICRAHMDIRVCPTEKNEDVLEAVKSLADKYDVRIDVIKNTPSGAISRDDKLMKLIEGTMKAENYPYIVSYATPTCDAHWFINRGVPAVNGMGPNGGNVHAPDEWVSISSLDERVKLFYEIIKSF